MTTRTNLAKIERARIMITAATNGEISRKLQELGLDAEVLQQGKALYQECIRTHHAEANATAAKTECAAAVRLKTQSVQEQYSKLAKTARAIFRDERATLQRLGLVGRRSPVAAASPDNEAASSVEPPLTKRTYRATDSQAVFLGFAGLLYDTALGHPEILAELSRVGYGEARLRREHGELGALAAFDVEKDRLTAAAKLATAEHRAAVAQLQKWMSRFAGVVTPALDNRPDLLNSMGIKPRPRPAMR